MVPLKQLTGAEVGQPSQSYAFPLVLVVTCLAQQSLQVGRGDGSQRLSHRESPERTSTGSRKIRSTPSESGPITFLVVALQSLDLNGLTLFVPPYFPLSLAPPQARSCVRFQDLPAYSKLQLSCRTAARTISRSLWVISLACSRQIPCSPTAVRTKALLSLSASEKFASELHCCHSKPFAAGMERSVGAVVCGRNLFQKLRNRSIPLCSQDLDPSGWCSWRSL